MPARTRPGNGGHGGPPSKKNKAALWISGVSLVLLFTLFTFVYGRIIIDGDGLSYYALTLSLVHDRDFDLQNQKKEIQGVMAPINAITGKPASLFSGGFGVLYAPFLAASERIGSLSEVRLYPQNNRIPFAHALALFAGSALFALSALLIGFGFVVRKFAIHPAVAAVLCAAVLVGTPLLFYSVTMPSYAHAADAFLVTVVFALVLSDWKSPWRNVLVGAVLSLSVLLRNNNIVFWPVAAGALLWSKSGVQRGLAAFRTILWLVAGAIPFVILHAWFNLSQYGKLLTTGYKVQMQEGFLSEMLLHPDAGLFLWAPITLLAVIGLLGGSMQKRMEAVVSLIAVILVFLSVQFQGNWWGGCSFGPRFFTHLFFLLGGGTGSVQRSEPQGCPGPGAGLCTLDISSPQCVPRERRIGRWQEISKREPVPPHCPATPFLRRKQLSCGPFLS